jgi:putative endopeptidase
MDRSINPGDDFSGYADGNRVKTTPIPSDRSSFIVLDILAEETSRPTADLIKEAVQSAGDSEARQVSDYYDAIMNEEAIEDKGLSPLKAELQRISAINCRQSLAQVLGGQLRADVDPLNYTNSYTDRLFGLWVVPDFNIPTRNVPYLLQGGLGLPNHYNYFRFNADEVELQAKYRAHITAVLKLALVKDADAQATRIYDLEQKIALERETLFVSCARAAPAFMMMKFALRMRC